MFHEDDVAVADAEADVILDVVEEHTAQRRDRDVLRSNAAAGQGRVEAGEPPLVVEDVTEKRIFVRPFRLHGRHPFFLSLLYHIKRKVVRGWRQLAARRCGMYSGFVAPLNVKGQG